MYFDGVRSGNEGNELPAGYVKTAEASGGPLGALPRGRCAGLIRCARQREKVKRSQKFSLRFARAEFCLGAAEEKEGFEPRSLGKEAKRGDSESREVTEATEKGKR